MKTYYRCDNCQGRFSDTYDECPRCASKNIEMLSATKLFSPLLDLRQATLRIIHNKEGIGQYIPLMKQRQIIGSQNDSINIHDEALNAVHAAFSYNKQGELFVEDLDSINGVYLRVREEILLQDKDIIRCAQRYFLFERFDTANFETDTQYPFLSSPHNNAKYRLAEILFGGMRGSAMSCSETTFTVGRSQKTNFSFPDDAHLSPYHFQISWIQDEAYLTDLDSANGTYLRIQQGCPLQHGDTLLLGDTILELSIV